MKKKFAVLLMAAIVAIPTFPKDRESTPREVEFKLGDLNKVRPGWYMQLQDGRLVDVYIDENGKVDDVAGYTHKGQVSDGDVQVDEANKVVTMEFTVTEPTKKLAIEEALPITMSGGGQITLRVIRRNGAEGMMKVVPKKLRIMRHVNFVLPNPDDPDTFVFEKFVGFRFKRGKVGSGKMYEASQTPTHKVAGMSQDASLRRDDIVAGVIRFKNGKLEPGDKLVLEIDGDGADGLPHPRSGQLAQFVSVRDSTLLGHSLAAGFTGAAFPWEVGVTAFWVGGFNKILSGSTGRLIPAGTPINGDAQVDVPIEKAEFLHLSVDRDTKEVAGTDLTCSELPEKYRVYCKE